MKQRVVCLFVIIVAMAVAGCATGGRQPRLNQAMINPAALQPGGSAVITVEVKDRHGVVDRVIGVIKEDPRIEFRLHDDGQEGDQNAGDGVWSMLVDVPFQAAPGQYEFIVTAYNSEGDALLVRAEEGGVKPLTVAFPLSIEYPSE